MRKLIMIIPAVLIVSGAVYFAANTLLGPSPTAVTADETDVRSEVQADKQAGDGANAGMEVAPPDDQGTANGAENESGGAQFPVSEDVDDGSEVSESNGEEGEDGVAVIAEPASIAVMVNKSRRLPIDYRPDDLVYPDVRFIFEEKAEKRMMRKVAAEALERMFAAAEEDGILLAGVSGYRSGDTQKALFEYYARRDGEEAASRYSARPGHSEHQTGLAMDVSGSTGECAATDCFAETGEAEWLAEHAHEFGFIVRYPQGKEEITGYKYEPWHLRYVGMEIAEAIRERGVTLEEYYDQAVEAAGAGNGVAESAGETADAENDAAESAGETADAGNDAAESMRDQTKVAVPGFDSDLETGPTE